MSTFFSKRITILIVIGTISIVILIIALVIFISNSYKIGSKTRSNTFPITNNSFSLMNSIHFPTSTTMISSPAKIFQSPTPTTTKSLPSPTPKKIVPIPSSTPTQVPLSESSSVTRKVMVIDFNPIIESQGNYRVRDIEGWNDPIILENQYINDVKTVSGGYIQYQIATRLANVDKFPTKDNGYVFTDSQYLSAVMVPDDNARTTIDYLKLLNDYDVCGRVNRGEIDELWLWGGPWFGYFEARMAGPGAFFTNSEPISGSSCAKKLIIMGFSYERGVSEMLEDLGHAMEGTMTHVYGEDPRFQSGTYTSPWGKFATSDSINPGRAGCGWMHYAPNSQSDYDWSNKRFVQSYCDDWLNYPNLTVSTTSINCDRWNCDGYQYKKWWLSHLPRASGKTNGHWNNWWRYFGEIN